MLNWLTNLFSSPIADLKAAWKWLTGAISAVYSYFDNLINQLDDAINWLERQINRYINDIEQGLRDLGDGIYWVIHTGLPDALHWAEREIAKAYNYALGLYHAAINELNKLLQWIQSELDKLIQWVLRNIWDPLWSGIQRVIRWIENEGAYVYYLLTHPDQLALLIGRYLLSSWMNLTSKYARIFVRWLMHAAINEASFVASKLEDLISSLF